MTPQFDLFLHEEERLPCAGADWGPGYGVDRVRDSGMDRAAHERQSKTGNRIMKLRGAAPSAGQVERVNRYFAPDGSMSSGSGRTVKSGDAYGQSVVPFSDETEPRIPLGLNLSDSEVRPRLDSRAAPHQLCCGSRG